MGNSSGDVVFAENTPLDREYNTVKSRVISQLMSEPGYEGKPRDFVNQTGDPSDEIELSLEQLADTELVGETDRGYTVNAESDLYHAVYHLERVRVQHRHQSRLEEVEISDELVEAADWLSGYLDSELNIT